MERSNGRQGQAMSSPKRIPVQVPMPPPSIDVSPVVFATGTSSTSSTSTAPSSVPSIQRDAHAVRACPSCRETFSLFRRRYRCPYCLDVVCRKCSKSLKKVQHHDDAIPHAPSSTSTSPKSSTGSGPLDDGTSSQSSRSSSVSSNVSSTSSRRVKARCCKTCATFTPAMKAPSRCELCRSTAGVLRKKLKCQVCQKFACKACGQLHDGVPFGIQSEAKVWICTVCVGTFEKQREKLKQNCHLCKEKFAEFKRRCYCKTCGVMMCVQCSVSVETMPQQPLKLDVRECAQCVDASKAKAPTSEDVVTTSRTSSLHLISAFEFTKDDRDTSAFGSRMRAVERSCAAVLVAVGVTVLIVVALLVYFYVVSVVIEDSWVAAWYPQHIEDL